jgi:chromosomal replication initiation ATPase DnaA
MSATPPELFQYVQALYCLQTQVQRPLKIAELQRMFRMAYGRACQLANDVQAYGIVIAQTGKAAQWQDRHSVAELVGEWNHYAIESANTIVQQAQAPGKLVMITGAAGIGKTHLMASIKNRAQQLHPELNIQQYSALQCLDPMLNDGDIASSRLGQDMACADMLLLDDYDDLLESRRMYDGKQQINQLIALLLQRGKWIVLSGQLQALLAEAPQPLYPSPLILLIESPQRNEYAALLESFLQIERVCLSPEIKLLIQSSRFVSIKALRTLISQLAIFQRFWNQTVSADYVIELLREMNSETFNVQYQV